MAYEDFTGNGDYRLQDKTLRLIRLSNTVLEDFAGQGYELTLRQLYYQLVAGGHIPNNMSSYRKLGTAVSTGRNRGLIDWQRIVDRLREPTWWQHYAIPKSAVLSAAMGYAIDLWEDQPHRLEVWVEKDALSGVVHRACSAFQVPYLVCRGYASQTAVYDAAKRMQEWKELGYKPIILHLGDHDPSGCHMTSDNRDRVHYYSSPWLAERLEVPVRRLALNMDQITQYKPPPNPAKETDSRRPWYIKTFKTQKSWELDALNPKVIVDLIQNEIKSLLDRGKFGARVDQQEAERAGLHAIADDYDMAVKAKNIRKARDAMQAVLSEVSTTARYNLKHRRKIVTGKTTKAERHKVITPDQLNALYKAIRGMD